jgi:superoxide dismutase
VGKEEILFQIRTYTVGGGLDPLKLNVKKTFNQFEQLDEQLTDLDQTDSGISFTWPTLDRA